MSNMPIKGFFLVFSFVTSVVKLEMHTNIMPLIIYEFTDIFLQSKLYVKLTIVLVVYFIFNIPIFRYISYPFNTTIFHFNIWIETFVTDSVISDCLYF